ncbi:hypothetical protein Hanom_Chr01g00044891 [Helianthus anomalus]
MSFIGVEVKKTVPYNKVVKHVNPKLYEDLWEYAKGKRTNWGSPVGHRHPYLPRGTGFESWEWHMSPRVRNRHGEVTTELAWSGSGSRSEITPAVGRTVHLPPPPPKKRAKAFEFYVAIWKITDDLGKTVTLSKAKCIMRKFRYKLRKKYVYKDESPDKDKDKTPENDTSNDPFEKYDYLDSELWGSFVAIVDSKEWKETSRKAKKIVEKNTDPSHVGRCGYCGLEPHVESRWNQLVSSYPILDLIQDDRSKMYTVSRAPFNPVTKLYELSEHFVSEGELKGTLKKLSIQKCKLLDPYDQGAPTVIGMGRVHPSPERIIYNSPMIDGFVI